MRIPLRISTNPSARLSLAPILSESRQGGIFKDSNVRRSLTTRGPGVFYLLLKAVVHWSHLGSLATAQMPGPSSEIQKPVSLRRGCSGNKIPRGFCSHLNPMIMPILRTRKIGTERD